MNVILSKWSKLDNYGRAAGAGDARRIVWSAKELSDGEDFLCSRLFPLPPRKAADAEGWGGMAGQKGGRGGCWGKLAMTRGKGSVQCVCVRGVGGRGVRLSLFFPIRPH